jgi:hypothetical protein
VRLGTAVLDGMPGDQAGSCLLAAVGGGTSRHTAARLRVIAGCCAFTRHECRTSLLMISGRSLEADRNPSAMVTVTLSCSS